MLSAIWLVATLAEAAAPHWDYHGAAGPDHWGELAPSFRTCATGRQQSPVDLRGAAPGALPALEIDYPTAPLTASNNGHTIELTMPSGTLRIGNDSYKLEEIHFHHPSEHTVDGRRFPLELHAVHRGPKGLAVIAVLFQPGASNPALAQLFRSLPARAGERASAGAVDIAQLLPQARDYFTYEGSLTTPPCSEGVRWIVLATPVTADSRELNAFARLFPDNSRPLQPLAGRPIEETRADLAINATPSSGRVVRDDDRALEASRAVSSVAVPALDSGLRGRGSRQLRIARELIADQPVCLRCVSATTTE